MRWVVKYGDILDESADVLVCSANVFLNLSGGVGGALLLRGGAEVQKELWSYLAGNGLRSVAPGSVIRTGPGGLSFKHILHAVAVDPFYDSSVEILEKAIDRALRISVGLGAQSVVMPALATGYGHLSIEEFAWAVQRIRAEALRDLSTVAIVVRDRDDAQRIGRFLVQD